MITKIGPVITSPLNYKKISQQGTDVYGTPCGPLCKDEWSKKFSDSKFNQFLFITGDQKKWLIADRDEVIGSWYENADRIIYKSSNNDKVRASCELTNNTILENFQHQLWCIGLSQWSSYALVENLINRPTTIK